MEGAVGRGKDAPARGWDAWGEIFEGEMQKGQMHGFEGGPIFQWTRGFEWPRQPTVTHAHFHYSGLGLT